MQLYVPEIGDTFKLTQPWTFNLYRETRNNSLWSYYNCNRIEQNPDPVPLKEAEQEIKEIQSRVKKIVVKAHPLAWNSWDRTETVYASQEDKDRLCKLQILARELARRPSWAVVTLPVDTVLKLDRIYVRKGISEYSSLTFFATIPGPVKESAKKVKPRFWAKLADCRNIHFDPVEK